MVDKCSNGHPKTPENTALTKEGWRICIVCRRKSRLAHVKGKGRARFNMRAKEKGRERKTMLLQMLGGACVDCGYAGHPAALDFDHIDPSTKEFQIGRSLQRKDFDKVTSEAMKCEIRCANCHRIRTWMLGHNRNGRAKAA